MSQNEKDRESPIVNPSNAEAPAAILSQTWESFRQYAIRKGLDDPGAMDTAEAARLLFTPEPDFLNDLGYTGALRLPPEDVYAYDADLESEASEEQAVSAGEGEIRWAVEREQGEWVLYVATTGGVNQGWIALVEGPAQDEITCVTRPGQCHGNGEVKKFSVPKNFLGRSPMVSVYACQFEEISGFFSGATKIQKEDFLAWVENVKPLQVL